MTIYHIDTKPPYHERQLVRVVASHYSKMGGWSNCGLPGRVIRVDSNEVLVRVANQSLTLQTTIHG